MGAPIERVTVVGGGTAGWLTALIVDGIINKGRETPAVKVTIIESPKVSTIGVGESTIQSIKNTLRYIGINETDFIRRCNASFKLGLRFIGWSDAEGRGSSEFFHPLNDPPNCGGLSPVYHFQKFGPHWKNTSFGENIAPNASVVASGRGPRRLQDHDYEWEINYAYHMDAALFATFMRDVAVSRGVEHIKDDVVDVVLDESGSISELKLEQRGRYPVEFVIDCTGFRALILSRMGGAPFVSANNRIINDRAIPLQVPHRSPTLIEPCTRAIALNAGWAWRVPLYDRVGTGYVYSSAFVSDDQAAREFVDHLRKSGDLAPNAPEPDLRVIGMRVGYTREPWVRNCVAIGLSSGFVEPLEATAIYTIDVAARMLVMNFPDKSFSPALINAYNEQASKLSEEIIDFLQTIYKISKRAGPYWNTVRSDITTSDWLQHKLELWKSRLPEEPDTRDRQLFDHFNYIYILCPNNYFAQTKNVLDGSIKLEHWEAYGRDLRSHVNKLMGSLPSHYQLLTHIRSPNAPLTKEQAAASTLLRWPQ